MTNTNLLKSKMVLMGNDDFVKCIAIVLDITRQTASDKLYGKSNFNQTEIALLTKHYALTADDIKNIFVGGE